MRYRSCPSREAVHRATFPGTRLEDATAEELEVEGATAVGRSQRPRVSGPL